ncbi:MAG: gliding motility-associated C-terminal domain-containing protein [Bacteroidales bacterium]|nr:gliding motility-associated C-terminal domain-containing protein [Bacteroidales bacterium]
MGTIHRPNQLSGPKAVWLRHLLMVWLVVFLGIPKQTLSQDIPCNKSTQGTDFWVMFLVNFTPQASNLKLIVATNEPTDIQVFNHLKQWDTIVSAGAHSTVEIPISIANGGTIENETVYNNALHVVSTYPISLYASNYQPATYDIATVLPSSALGTEYISQVYTSSSTFTSEIGFAATMDSTVITVINYPNVGFIRTVTLMQGQSIQFSGPNLSGVRVSSNNKPFAMFQGDACALVGGCGACDHLYEQALPVKLWGENFLLVSTADRPSGDVVLVTSSDDNCTLTLDDSMTVASLNRGETVEIHLPNNEAHMLSATKPVYTCIYLKGINCGNTNGDPASVTVPPIEQRVKSITFQAITTDLTNLHYANIVTRTIDLPYMMLDDVNIGNEFIPMSNGYSYVRKSLTSGVHTLENEQGGFMAHFYGLGTAESYAYIAGMATYNLGYGMTVDSVNIRIHSDQLTYCIGDTAHYELHTNDDTVDIEWRVDGMVMATDIHYFDYPLFSSDWHTVECIVNLCDTLATKIYVRPQITDIIEVARCETEGFTLGDSVYFTSCDISVHFIDNYGCPSDSVYRLTIVPTSHTYVSDSVCFNGTYEWRGMTCDSAGTYSDTLKTVAVGCDSVIHLTLTTIPKPSTGIDWTTDCHENHYTLTAILDDHQAIPFLWSSDPHDPLLDGHETDTVIYAVPSTRTIYSLAFDYQCPYVDTVILRHIEWPQADFVVTPEWMTYDQPYFDAYDRSRQVNQRQWFINGVPQNERSAIFHYDAEEGIDSVLVSLAVSNVNCGDTLHRTVPFVRTGHWAPNVFIPNDENGINTTFSVTLLDGVAEELYIFNRQGALIYHGQGPDPQWDGKYNGVACPQGAYVWTLRFHYNYQPTRTYTLTGTVTLIR